MERIGIVVKTSVCGIHNYPDAPEGVSFLREPHRHIFNIEADIEVFHSDRELEFILVKEFIESSIESLYWDSIKGGIIHFGSRSCEDIAKGILYELLRKYGERAIKVSVYEDGENGAYVCIGSTR